MALSFDEIKTTAAEMESAQAERNTMFEEMEKMYLLEADGLPGEDWIKDTISPDPRNAVQGANRLLAATEPKWSVPPGTNSPTTKKRASSFEKAAAAIWTAACRIAGRSLHNEVCLSGLLYSEVHLAVMSTKDLLALASSPADKRRREQAAKQTPLMFECINPSQGYPEWDLFGLRRYYSKRSMRVDEIRGRWGEDALPGKKGSDLVDYHDYWDITSHAVWAQGESEPFLNEAHNLPAIPVSAAIAEGSRLFYKPDQQQRQPMLYTMWKTNLWKRQNLSLTIMYSLIFSIGANPLYVYKRGAPDRTAPARDHSTPGGLIVLDANEDYQALAKQILDPSMMQGLQTAQQLSEESTIYRQALGEPLGGNAPFSMVSMLSQAGRLPLVPYQRMCSFAIAQAMLIGFMMLKAIGGGAVTIKGQSETIELNPAEIPDDLDMTANLDISLPQDERQAVAVAAQATGGPKPLVSMRHAREQWLNIGQSDDMDKEIMEESFLWLQFQKQMEQAMMQQQQQMQGGAVPPGGAMPPGGQQGGMPPDLAAQMQGQLQSTGAEPGLPGMMAGAPMEPGMPGGGGGPDMGMTGGVQ